jgi:hypothetical protein
MLRFLENFQGCQTGVPLPFHHLSALFRPAAQGMENDAGI